MNNKNGLVIGIIIIALVLIGVFAFMQLKKDRGVAGTTETAVSEDYGFSFDYVAGPEGFTLVKPPAQDNGILEAFILMPTVAYEEYKASTDAREAPASISIFVLANEDDDAVATTTAMVGTSTASSTPREGRIVQLENWARANNAFTLFEQAKGTPEQVEIDGVKALHYLADGLYQQEIYLISYKDRVYMFAGQYNEESDMTKTGFQPLMDSVSFD